MSDLLLRHQYTDRDGHEIYNIIDLAIADAQGDPIVLGSMRMQRGKDDGYRGSGVRVEWADWVPDPTNVPAVSQ